MYSQSQMEINRNPYIISYDEFIENFNACNQNSHKAVKYNDYIIDWWIDSLCHNNDILEKYVQRFIDELEQLNYNRANDENIGFYGYRVYRNETNKPIRIKIGTTRSSLFWPKNIIYWGKIILPVVVITVMTGYIAYKWKNELMSKLNFTTRQIGIILRVADEINATTHKILTNKWS